MNSINEISENNFISFITEKFSRDPFQINSLNESDSELITLPGSENVLAITTDNIVEEIDAGLYKDPYQIGWMTVIVNISDLSAVGAVPLGILLNETLIPAFDKKFLSELHIGISDACKKSGTFVLGGDTNFSTKFQIGACAVGLIQDKKMVTRLGANEGDYVFTSGYLGRGNTYALSVYLGKKCLGLNLSFMPEPRINEGNIIRKYASSCMDTSDGAIATLDQLMRLNNLGFSINSALEDYLDPEVIQVSNKMNFPLWLNLAGIHGEFELIFTIGKDNIDNLFSEAEKIGWKPIQLGRVTSERILKINNDKKFFEIDSAKIRNLFKESNGDIEKYINELTNINSKLESV